MTSLLHSLYVEAIFRLSVLTWLGVLDMLLVAATFYLVLSLVRRSRAASLLRGTLALAVILFVGAILLPLPTFDWLVRGTLLTLAVAVPIIFQPELRRLLERMGRSAGLGRAVRQTAAENLLPRLLRTVENLSVHCTGALIVLEGRDSLQDVAESGVDVGGKVTSELLQTIFHPETPLHDGAVILREDQVVTAGCVLPLTQQPLDESERRLGTRHRAAVGLSENSDALVIVVSEETGQISVARYGQLQRPLDSAMLREHLLDFFIPVTTARPAWPKLSLPHLLNRTRHRVRRRPSQPTLRRLFSDATLLSVALLLALAAWSFVSEQTNPMKRVQVENIPLRMEDIPPGLTLMSSPPAGVSALIQTTANVRDTLRPDSFQAIVSLHDTPAGLHRLPVQVNSGTSQVRVLGVEPPMLDVELVPVISRTLKVTVDLPESQSLSPAYAIASAPTATPDQVQVVGPAPLVERVSRVQATWSLANGDTWLREVRPLKALDEAGQEVTGVKLQPAQVEVSLTIRQRQNARDVGIRAVTSGAPAPGYWLSGLSVAPAGVTLQGSPDRLAEIGSFIDTLPVDLSQAAGNLSVHVPLNLPPDLRALDSTGNSVQNVVVQAQISARQGDLVVNRPVELLGTKPGITVTIDPPEVELLLSGPLPTLTQVEENQGLIRVLIETANLTPGQNAELTPVIIAPDDIRVQLVSRSVLVRVL